MRTDTTLGEILRTVEARQASVHNAPFLLNELRPKGDQRFEVAGETYYVPADDEHPIKQLCSQIGMTHTFYKANPGALNSTIFETRFRGEEAERVLRYRETANGRRLLAILPKAHQAPTYADLLRPLAEVVDESTLVRLAPGDLDSTHRLSLRVTFPDYAFTVKDDDPLEVGFALDASEDGIGKLRLSTLLYRLVCSNGLIVQYGGSDLVEFNYRGLPKFALDAVLKSAAERFAVDLKSIEATVKGAAAEPLTKDEALAFVKSLETRRDVAVTLLRKVKKEIDAIDVPTISRFDVINQITWSAQQLPYTQRLNHETFAARLLGLDLPEVTPPADTITH
jgi:hypothetical protein